MPEFKDLCPGIVSCVGESSLDTIKREIYEEIGINVNVKCVHSVTSFRGLLNFLQLLFYHKLDFFQLFF